MAQVAPHSFVQRTYQMLTSTFLGRVSTSALKMGVYSAEIPYNIYNLTHKDRFQTKLNAVAEAAQPDGKLLYYRYATCHAKHRRYSCAISGAPAR